MSGTSGVITLRAASIFQAQGKAPAQEDHAISAPEKKIFVVADGFGGPEAGKNAARAACDAVFGFLQKEAGDLEATLPFVLRSYFSLAGNVLFNALIHANRAVLKNNLKKNVHEKGGASAIASYLDGDLLALANVGGCGAWILRDDRITELVVPRTYARLLNPFGDSGDLNVPLMALGTAEDIEPEIVECRIQAGDWVVLKTDGIEPELKQGLREVKQRQCSYSEVTEAVSGLFGREHRPYNSTILLMIF